MKTPKQVEQAIQTISDFCRKKKDCVGCPLYSDCRNWWEYSPDYWREEKTNE